MRQNNEAHADAIRRDFKRRLAAIRAHTYRAAPVGAAPLAAGCPGAAAEFLPILSGNFFLCAMMNVSTLSKRVDVGLSVRACKNDACTSLNRGEKPAP